MLPPHVRLAYDGLELVTSIRATEPKAMANN